MIRNTARFAMLALMPLAFATFVGCDSMTDYRHNGEQTDRSDTMKTGSGTYGGTNSAYEAGNPAGNGSTTAGVTGVPSVGTGTAAGAGSTNNNPANHSGLSTGTNGVGQAGTGTYGGSSVGGSNSGNTANTGTTGPNTE